MPKVKRPLHDSWNAHLSQIHDHMDVGGFDEIYDGTAVVSDLSKNRIGLHLSDGRKIRHVPITPDISTSHALWDQIEIVLGRKGKRWWPLEVMSITGPP